MSEAEQPRSLLRRATTVVVTAVNICVALGLVLSAYSGYVEPLKCKYAVVAVMTFPCWVIAAFLLLLTDIIWWRRNAIFLSVMMLCCIGQIHDFCPLNLRFGGLSADERARSFTVMTYNVCFFNDFTDTRGACSNAQADYILTVRPDIVCLQEAEYMQPTIRNNITEEQLSELQELYPYIFTNKEFAIISRFPTEPLPFTFPKESFNSGDIIGCRMNVDGMIVNIFNVHLRSLKFSKDQKNIFKEATDVRDVNRSELMEVRHELMPRLYQASLERAQQVKLLVSYIRKFGGENVIVCGDFNDPVGCYGLNMLEGECDMRQAYTDAAFRPNITFHANHFYFRIDHILYRGAMKAVDIERGSLKASDHYPLVATFVTEKGDDNNRNNKK